jgi:hypothetical protein
MSSITRRVVYLGLVALATGFGCKKPAASSRALNVDALVDKNVKRQQTCGPSPGDFRGLLKAYDELKSDDKSDRTRLAVKANEIDSKFDVITRGSDKLDDTWRTDIKRVLLAVPDEMFYTILDRGWRIEFGSEAKVGEACKGTFEASEKQIDSKTLRKHLHEVENSLKICWRTESIGDTKSVVIHVMADPAKDPDHQFPHISLLPAVAYAYGDVMINAYTKMKGDAKDTYKAMSQLRTNLTVDFVDGDLDKQLSIRKRYAKVFGAAYRASPEFQGFVFAEAADSYYCSQATNDHFAGRDGGDIRLKKTYAAFDGDKGWSALLSRPWFERLGR